MELDLHSWVFVLQISELVDITVMVFMNMQI